MSRSVDKLIEDTEKNLIDWNSTNNLKDISGYFEVCMNEELKVIYKRGFPDESIQEGELVENAFIGECKRGGYLVLLRVRVNDVEGWEIYKVSNGKYMPLGIYHTFGDNYDKVMLNKIYDLILMIKMNRREIHIDNSAKEEIEMYMQGEKRKNTETNVYE